MEETVLSADNGRPSGTGVNEELTGEAWDVNTRHLSAWDDKVIITWTARGCMLMGDLIYKNIHWTQFASKSSNFINVTSMTMLKVKLYKKNLCNFI